MAPYAYFVNLVNSKINQGELASFNNLYGRKTDELIKAVSQFKKTGDDTKVKEILNNYSSCNGGVNWTPDSTRVVRF
jgi:hypothetical protein